MRVGCYRKSIMHYAPSVVAETQLFLCVLLIGEKDRGNARAGQLQV
jgi:hypothetical protein